MNSWIVRRTRNGWMLTPLDAFMRGEDEIENSFQVQDTKDIGSFIELNELNQDSAQRKILEADLVDYVDPEPSTLEKALHSFIGGEHDQEE